VPSFFTKLTIKVKTCVAQAFYGRNRSLILVSKNLVVLLLVVVWFAVTILALLSGVLMPGPVLYT
jgi:hypothetical protein